MSSDAEIKRLAARVEYLERQLQEARLGIRERRQDKARIDVLERLVFKYMRRDGMTDPEISDIELDEAIGLGAETLDYTAIKDTLSKRIAQRAGGRQS